MSLLAPTLQAFFTERLIGQRQASSHTIAAYRDTMRLLLTYAQQRLRKHPSNIDFSDLDAPMIAAFLQHLQHDRNNSARTRNARLAAIRSLYRYAALRHPEHADLIQRVLAIPSKRFDRALVSFLTDPEVTALLAAPDRTTWTGRRDHAMLLLAIQTGLRASELCNLNIADLHMATGAHISCRGKGRKQRATPLTRETVAVLAVWLTERAGQPPDPLFPTRRGTHLTRDGLQQRLATHATTAARTNPELATKKITPHVLRHTAAMRLLSAGVDIAIIALWLGHESPDTTQAYLHADLAIKEQALARTAPPTTTPGRYKPPDKLLAYLEAL